jgi:hypothetical protein
VTTRGHFDSHWWYGDRLTDGHTAYDYSTVGAIPEGRDEVLITVYGWLTATDETLDHSATVWMSLSNNGYDAPVVGFSYDSGTSTTDWWPATDIAERNGPRLADFLARCMGHLGGGQGAVGVGLHRRTRFGNAARRGRGQRLRGHQRGVRRRVRLRRRRGRL